MKIFELVNKGIGNYGLGGVSLVEADLLQIESDSVLGVLPAGGTTGQVLKKINATDFNTVWATDETGGSANSDFTASALPVAFDIPRKYGFTTPITANITFGITAAFESSMAKILHNHTVAPTITGPAGVTVVKDGGTYVVSVNNIIYLVCHKNDAGTVDRVSYTITQNQP